jgi:hypothetical protein
MELSARSEKERTVLEYSTRYAGALVKMQHLI